MHKILNKNNKITILSIKSKKLTEKQLLAICKLKNSFWVWSIQKQKLWFKKNLRSSDVNNLFYVNTNLVGYTCLRKRKAYIDNITINYFYLDSFIIKKNWRVEGLAKILILYNNIYIIKNKTSSFLTCKKNLIKFYTKFGWKLLRKDRFKIINHKHRWFINESYVNGMTYNLDKNLKKKILYSIS
mgnify:CR=1 FL=1|tara:strand:+ start:745 stop:1299 length:555 start_codon:yes stop_codon:yes gene_type:complete